MFLNWHLKKVTSKLKDQFVPQHRHQLCMKAQTASIQYSIWDISLHWNSNFHRKMNSYLILF